jgi:hypothetical protein
MWEWGEENYQRCRVVGAVLASSTDVLGPGGLERASTYPAL